MGLDRHASQRVRDLPKDICTVAISEPHNRSPEIPCQSLSPSILPSSLMAIVGGLEASRSIPGKDMRKLSKTFGASHSGAATIRASARSPSGASRPRTGRGILKKYHSSCISLRNISHKNAEVLWRKKHASSTPDAKIGSLPLSLNSSNRWRPRRQIRENLLFTWQ